MVGRPGDVLTFDPWTGSARPRRLGHAGTRLAVRHATLGASMHARHRRHRITLALTLVVIGVLLAQSPVPMLVSLG